MPQYARGQWALKEIGWWLEGDPRATILQYPGLAMPESKISINPNVHSSTIYSRQDMEATWKSISRWMDKEDIQMANKHM